MSETRQAEAANEDGVSKLAQELLHLSAVVARARRVGARAPGACPQYPVLALLSEGPRRVSSIAEAFGEELSTASRQVSALAASGHVTKVSDPCDNRACLVELTQLGKDAFGQENANRLHLLAQVLKHWSSEDINQLSKQIERLYSGLDDLI